MNPLSYSPVALTPLVPPVSSSHLSATRPPAPRMSVMLRLDADPSAHRRESSHVAERYHDPVGARVAHGHRSDILAPALLRSDPLGDAVAEAFSHLPPGRGMAMLNGALMNGIDSVPDAPDALIALFRQVDEIPMWVDWDELALGGAAFMRTGMLGLLTLMCYSLPMAYAVSDGNKPLTFSGKLVGRADRRLNETGRFVIETCRRGGLRRDGEGFRITIKVRLMHAQVRRLLLKSDRWDSSRWGIPINQADMAGTNITFSAMALRGLRILGIRMSDRERGALMQLWRYSGYLTGVEPDLLCATESEAERLAGLTWMTRRPADDASRDLFNALMNCKLEPPLDKIGNMAGMLQAMSRAMVGKEVADELQIPHTPAAKLLPLLRAAVMTGEVARKTIPAVDRWMLNTGAKLWEVVISKGLAGKPPEYRMTTAVSVPHALIEKAVA